MLYQLKTQQTKSAVGAGANISISQSFWQTHSQSSHSSPNNSTHEKTSYVQPSSNQDKKKISNIEKKSKKKS